MQAYEMVVEIDHPGHGRVRMTGFPTELSAIPTRLRLPAPALGKHTDAVLRGLGYSADHIAEGARYGLRSLTPRIWFVGKPNRGHQSRELDPVEAPPSQD